MAPPAAKAEDNQAKAARTRWQTQQEERRKAEVEQRKKAEAELRERWAKYKAAEKAKAEQERKFRAAAQARARAQAEAQQRARADADARAKGRPPPPRPPGPKPTRVQPPRKAKPPMRPEQRAQAVLEPVREALRKGSTADALKALAKARATAESDPNLPLTEAMLDEMKEQIETLPPAAEQVLQHAVKSPFSALGIERLAAARVLNTVNKRTLLKNYRKLALRLHPDKCQHLVANDAMQALNVAYDKITAPPKPKPQPGKKPQPKRK